MGRATMLEGPIPNASALAVAKLPRAATKRVQFTYANLIVPLDAASVLAASVT